MSTPKSGALIIAALASAAIVLVGGIAVWRHLGGTGGDIPAERSATISPVSAALTAAGMHSDQCTADLAAMTGVGDALSKNPVETMTQLEQCGEIARALAERGYNALDSGTGSSTSELRAAYLDAAGSLFSVYEIQGDDFDVAFDMLHRARAAGAPLTGLASDVSYILTGPASDVAAARQEAARAEKAYRKRG